MRTICFCNSNIPWGGGETWHLRAAFSLAARGWRVFLLCHPEGALYRKALEKGAEGSAAPGGGAAGGAFAVGHPGGGVEPCAGVSSGAGGEGSLTVMPLRLSRFSFLNPFLRSRLERFFRRERVHGVVMNLPADLKIAGPAARAAGVPHIVYRRGSALPVRNSVSNRYLYGRVISRLIVNSEATRRLALSNNARLIPEERITLLPNGFDIAGFDAALEAARVAAGTVEGTAATPARAAPGAASGSRGEAGAAMAGKPEPSEGGAAREAAREAGRPFIIGNAGRLNKQKGQHLLLHLGGLLREAGLDFRLVIAGTGEREAELKALAAALGIQDKIEFRGFIEDLAPFWVGLDLFVLTSLWEGFGNVLLEAMLARKPVLAFAVSNVPELVRDGVNGRLFPLPREEWPNTPEGGAGCGQKAGTQGGEAGAGPQEETPLDAMAACVLELARDPARRRGMGEAGRAFALGFSQEAAMERLERLLA